MFIKIYNVIKLNICREEFRQNKSRIYDWKYFILAIWLAITTSSIRLRSIHLSANMTERDVAFTRGTHRSALSPNTIPSENDKEVPLACAPASPRSESCKSMGCVFYLNSRKRAKENERRDATQICNFKIFQRVYERKRERRG